MQPWKRTFVFSFLAQILSAIGFSFVLPFLPFFIGELGIANEADQAWWSGVILAAVGVTFSIFSPVWGAIADRYGRKPMVLRSMLAGAGVLFLMSHVQSVGQLLVCRLLQGALTGTIAASVALVASVTPAHRSGLAMGMMQAAVFLGLALGPLVGGMLADLAGYRTAFRAGAGIVLLAGILTYFGTQEAFVPPRKDGEPKRSLGSILINAGFLTAVGIMLLVRFSNTVINPSFPLVLKQIVASPDRLNTLTGVVIAFAALSGAVAAAWLGHMGDRLGHRRVLVVCCVGTGLSAAAHAMVTTLPMLALVHLIFGLTIAGTLPSINALIYNSVDRRHIGKAYGWATSFSMLGIALGPLTGGLLARELGLRAPFWFAGGSQLIVAAVALLVLRRSFEEPQRSQLDSQAG